MAVTHELHDELAYLDVATIQARFRAGTLTSLALVDALLERISILEADESTALHAVAGRNEQARAEARACDDATARGESLGVLHGIPVLIKDNIEAIGLPGLAGSTALLGRPSRDAPLVTNLRDAGAVLLGSTNLSEWANFRSTRSTSGWSASGGLVANPWALDRSAGGSSSGSGAAVAAGYAPLAVGTETDGSIICPSSLQGLVGLKPTVGTVSTACVVPISSSQDSPGPMGRCVDDVAALYHVLSGETPPDHAPIARAAFASTWLTGHPATDALCERFLSRWQEAGLEVERRDVPVPEAEQHGDEGTVMLAELYDDLGAYLSDRPGEGVRTLADVVAFENEHADVELAHFGHEYFEFALASGGRAGEAYAAARARNLAWAVDTVLTPALEGVDVLLAPAYAPAWKSDLTLSGHTGAIGSCATSAPAIAGWPILTVPLGLVDGLPVGLALIGRAKSEWTLIAAARDLELLVNETGYRCRPTWRAPRRG